MEEHEEEAIAKDDPYYLEMLRRTKNHRRRLKQNQIKNQVSLFNHPLLKFYHERKASQKKEMLDFEDHKLKMFQLIKWDRIKLIKADIEDKIHMQNMKKSKIKLLITLLYIKQFMNIISNEFITARD